MPTNVPFLTELKHEVWHEIWIPRLRILATVQRDHDPVEAGFATQSISAFAKLLPRVGVWVLIVGATAFLAAGVTLAALTTNHAATISITAVSSLVAGFVYALMLPRTLASAEVANEEVIRQQQEQLQSALVERERLEEEIARLKSAHINVDGYRRILKLGLISIKSHVREYQRSPCQSGPIFKEGGLLGIGAKERIATTELHNVILTEFEAQLGVDLQKLRFREDTPGRVCVTGVRREFQGFQSLRVAKELTLKIDSVRDRVTGELIRESILRNDGDASLRGDSMQNDLIERLRTGIGYEHLDDGIMQMTKAFLQANFAQLGCTLYFDPSEETSGLPLVEFLELKNNEVDAQLAGLECRKRKLLASSGAG